MRNDKSLRIQFNERFVDLSDEEMESFKNLGKPLPHSYRLIYPRLSDIFQPRQMPGKKSHCEIEYYDGTVIVVKGSYDDVCNLIDEREKLLDQYYQSYEE